MTRAFTVQGRLAKNGTLVLAGAAVISFAMWSIAFRAPLGDIYRLAVSDVERSYLLVVPLISLYLVALRRSRYQDMSRRKTLLGPAIVLAGLFVSWFGLERDVIVMWHGGAVISLIGLAVVFFGAQVLAAFAAPLLLLFAIVPVPGTIRQALAQPLQEMATEVTSFMLQLIGMPVSQAGNLLEINDRMVAVGEACDGMRLLLPLGIVIFAFVFSVPLRMGTRLFLVVVSGPIAIICNVIRLIPTAIAYGYAPSYASGVHDFGGWIMIPLAIWMLLQLLRLAAWLDLPVGRWRLVGA